MTRAITTSGWRLDVRVHAAVRSPGGRFWIMRPAARAARLFLGGWRWLP